jgi:acetylornithine deacetylase/succinyl-diaminopimelate desuccinylase family protein
MTSSEAYITGILQELVRISSINPPGNEKILAEHIASLLQDIGITTRIQTVNETRANAIGLLNGEKNGPILTLNGHLDTVPVKEDWNYPPFDGKIEGPRLYGLGSADMKGGIAAMIGAAKRIKESGEKLKGSLILSFVADEERKNAGTLKFLDEYKNIDYAVIGEPTSLNIVTSHRGVSRFRIKVFGKAGHASNPAQGVNAIYKMNGVISRLMILAESYCGDKKDYSSYPSLSVSIIEGGTAENIIPDKCEIIIDRRTVAGEKPADVGKEISSILEEVVREDKEFTYSFEIFVWVDAWKAKDDSKLLGFCDRAYQDCFNTNPVYTDLGATCEAILFAQRGVDVIVFGPGDMKNAHTKNEYIEIDQLIKAEDYYYRLIKEILM